MGLSGLLNKESILLRTQPWKPDKTHPSRHNLTGRVSIEASNKCPSKKKNKKIKANN